MLAALLLLRPSGLPSGLLNELDSAVGTLPGALARAHWSAEHGRSLFYVLKIFRKSLMFYSTFVSINCLNVSTSCLAFWGVLIDVIDLWIALHKDLNKMIHIQRLLRGCCQSAEAIALFRFQPQCRCIAFPHEIWEVTSTPRFLCCSAFTPFSNIWLLKKSHTDFHINARIQLVKRWF